MSQAEHGRATLKTVIAAAAMAPWLALGTSAIAQETDLAAILKAVIASNIAAVNDEDVDATLATIHRASPEFAATAEALAAHYDGLDTSAELVSFSFMGHDDEFAVARVKIKTSEDGDTGFADNTVDMIVLFNQEDGVWKIWSDMPLGVELAS